MAASFCWKCGGPLVKATTGEHRGEVSSAVRNYHGVEVTLHKSCAERFDEEEANDKFNWIKNPEDERYRE